MLDGRHKVQYEIGMANVLPLDKRVQILNMLCEGVSLRAISRLVGVSINTVSKLLVDAGETCLDLHDQLVTHVEAKNVQCDEIWSFCYAKQKNVPMLISRMGSGLANITAIISPDLAGLL